MIEYSVKINNESINVNSCLDHNEIIIDGNADKFFIRKINTNLYTVQKGKKIIEVVVVSSSDGNFVLLIDGYYYFVDPKTRLEELTEKILAKSDNVGQKTDIKAPMPGLILDINVAEGDIVKEGDHLIVLEAMKMENVIKSPVDGVVAFINWQKNDSVDKGEILLVLEQ